MRANYHPFLFTLMTLTATAELGLTAFLVSAGNETQTWASPRYHSLSVPRRSRCHPRLTESRSSLILLCFSSAWTLLFSGAYVLWIVDGAVHLLAQVASSAGWLLLTAVLWVRRPAFMRRCRALTGLAGCGCGTHAQHAVWRKLCWTSAFVAVGPECHCSIAT